jgi:hypothetical protein
MSHEDKGRKLWYWVSPCERVAITLTLREARTPIPELKQSKRVRQMLAKVKPAPLAEMLFQFGIALGDHADNLDSLLRLVAQQIYDRSKGPSDAQ